MNQPPAITAPAMRDRAKTDRSKKTVGFGLKEYFERKTLWEISKRKWVIGMGLYGLDCIWKWGGARDGLQEMEQYGDGFEGWIWRGSVVSLTRRRTGSSMGSGVSMRLGTSSRTWVVK